MFLSLRITARPRPTCDNGQKAESYGWESTGLGVQCQEALGQFDDLGLLLARQLRHRIGKVRELSPSPHAADSLSINPS